MKRILATLENGQRVTAPFTPLPAARTTTTQAVIVGGGTAGAIAGVTAAQLGLQAVVVEPNTFLGGVGTGGAIHAYYHGAKGGVQDGIDAATHKLELAISPAVSGFHQEAKKAALDAALANTCVTVRYTTRLTGVIQEGNRVVGVRVASRGQEHDILAPVTIDCSGDADVAALAGGAFQMGRPLDGMPQPYSTPCGALRNKRSISHRNFDAGYTVPTDGADLSRALIAGHRQHLIPEYTADNRMTYLAPHLGLREGRFILGDDTVTLRDHIDTVRRASVVFETKAHYDNHAKDWAFESDEAREWVVVCGFWSCPLKCDVPYGALLPRDLEGVLVACRGASMTHDAAQSFRMQRDMQKLGEVAATAAKLAVDAGVTPRQVPIGALQAALVKSGCLEALPEAGREGRKDTPFDTTPTAIEAHLRSTKPGPGIWAAGKVGDASVEAHLIRWMQDSDQHLAAHATLALGLRGSRAAVPGLVKLLESRDEFRAEGGHNTQRRWYAAMFLLEQLAAREGVQPLTAVLLDPTVDPRPQAFAMRALAAIGRAHADLRPAIAAAFEQVVGNRDFKPLLELQVSTLGSKNIEPLRAMFDLTIADALVRWDHATGGALLERYRLQGNARERRFAEQIFSRVRTRETAPAGV